MPCLENGFQSLASCSAWVWCGAQGSKDITRSEYLANFDGDGETKTAFASGTVSLNGLNWDMTEP